MTTIDNTFATLAAVNPTASTFAEWDNFSYTIGVDFDPADVDNYNAVTVKCKGTGVVTRFDSGKFPVDFDAARKFAAEQIKDKVKPNFSTFFVSFEESFDNFIILNTKYAIRRNYSLY